MRLSVIPFKQEQVDTGSVSLLQIISLMENNRYTAQRHGYTLSWARKLGTYYGYVKRDGKEVFTRVYNHQMLITALVYMHMDFEEYLRTGASHHNKGR